MNSVIPIQEPAIPWRLRSDLQIQAADLTADAAAWTIKDPLRLTYFSAEAEEMAFLKLLDGKNSLSQILHLLSLQFPNTDFSTDNLRQFLSSSVNGGLLRATVPGHSQRLNAIRKRQNSHAWLRRSLSLLTYRFRGIDPSRILCSLDRVFGWIFSIRCLILAASICGFAALIVYARREQLESELPSISTLFTATNLPILALSVLFVKVLHEFGHGLTCRHYGGECHELGILVVGIVPLLYCDVSDSWLQQDRRKRMLVAAAGIATELFLAAVFALLWSVSRNGFLHAFFLNVMIVCSLNTILINGNPLLKYDGYYVVSDWFGIPNLGAESRAAAVAVIDQVVLGYTNSPPMRRSVGFRLAMVSFGAASMVYRVLVVVTLLWFMHGTFKSWHLESLTGILVLSIAAGSVIAAIRGIRERITMVDETPNRRRRAFLGLCVLGFLVLCAVCVPFPYSLHAPFTLTPGLSSPIFALEEGEIEPRVQDGDQVQAGDTIAVFRNDGLESLVAQASGEYQVAATRANALATQRSKNSEVANALPAAEKVAQSRKARFEKLLLKEKNLTVASPVAGTVFSPRNRPRPRAQQTDGIEWFGQPLDPEVRSVWMSRQTLLCWVGTNEDFRAICLFPQEDIDLIYDGATAILTFASMPSAALQGNVTQRRTMPETMIDRELILNRMVVASPESSTPNETYFGVAVSIEAASSAHLPPLYSSGYAKVECRPVSLASRAWRYLCHTFTFN